MALKLACTEADPSPTCPMCTHEHCNECSWLGVTSRGGRRCTHSWKVRHRTLPSYSPIEPAQLIERLADDPQSRTPTLETPPVVIGQIHIEFSPDNRESVAQLFDVISACVRAGAIKITAEYPMDPPMPKRST